MAKEQAKEKERTPPTKRTRFTKHNLTFREKMVVMWVLTERRIRLWGRFKISAVFGIIGSMVALATFFVINYILGPSLDDYYAQYSGGSGFFTYILVGMAFGAFAGTSLSIYLGIIQATYFGNTLELILTSPMKFYTYFVSTVLWAFVTSTISIASYLLVGVFVFKVDLGTPSSMWLVILVLGLAVIAVSGIGLISASMFLAYDVKGNVEPISWFVSTSAGLVSGTMFPPEAFIEIWPPLYYLSRFLPHTYALRSFRLIMMGEGLYNPLIVGDLLTLVIFCMLLLPLGAHIFQRSMSKAERIGKLARWS